jgi:hypothetical protein
VGAASTAALASCYAQVWQQVSGNVDAAVAAAAQYDTLAIVGSEPDQQLSRAVHDLSNAFDGLAKPTQLDVAKLFDDVMLIIGYAQQVQQALSSGSSSGKSGGAGASCKK